MPSPRPASASARLSRGSEPSRAASPSRHEGSPAQRRPSNPVPPIPGYAGFVRRTSLFYDALQQMNDNQLDASRTPSERATARAGRRSTVRSGSSSQGLYRKASADQRAKSSRGSADLIETPTGRGSQDRIEPPPAQTAGSFGASWIEVPGSFSCGRSGANPRTKQMHFIDGGEVHFTSRTFRERFWMMLYSAGPLELLLLSILGIATALASIVINFCIRSVAYLQVYLSGCAVNALLSLPGLLPTLAPALDELEQGDDLFTFTWSSGDRYAWMILPYAIMVLVALLLACVALLSTLPPHGSRHAAGSGIPELKAILSGYWLPKYLSLHVLVAKITGLTAACAAQFVIGREGPMVHIAATLSVLLMKLRLFEAISLNPAKKRSAIASACAIGVVATFGTPIGGILFSIEVTATHYMVSNLWNAYFGAMCAMLSFVLFSDLKLISGVPHTSVTWERHLGYEHSLFFGLGVIQGLLAALIIRLFTIINRATRQYSLFKPTYRRFLTGLVVCILCVSAKFYFPPLRLGNEDLLIHLFSSKPLGGARHGQVQDGREEMRELWLAWSVCSREIKEKHFILGVDMCSIIPTLALLAAINIFLMITSINLPIPNGCFMPLFVIGAITGRLYGEILHQAFDLDVSTMPMATFSIVGAAALTAGTTQTLSTVLITLELTSQQSLLVPVLTGVITAYGVAAFLSKSIYDQILVLKGLPYMPHLRTEFMFQLTAENIMRPTQSLLSRAWSQHNQKGIETFHGQGCELVGSCEADHSSSELDGGFVDTDNGSAGPESGYVDPHRRFSEMSILDNVVEEDCVDPDAAAEECQQEDAEDTSEELVYQLPESNPFHPTQPGSDLRADQALPIMAYDMTVREIMNVCRNNREPFYPLVKSVDNPALMGAVTHAQLVEWFVDEYLLTKELETELEGMEIDGSTDVDDGWAANGNNFPIEGETIGIQGDTVQEKSGGPWGPRLPTTTTGPLTPRNLWEASPSLLGPKVPPLTPPSSSATPTCASETEGLAPSTTTSLSVDIVDLPSERRGKGQEIDQDGSEAACLVGAVELLALGGGLSSEAAANRKPEEVVQEALFTANLNEAATQSTGEVGDITRVSAQTGSVVLRKSAHENREDDVWRARLLAEVRLSQGNESIDSVLRRVTALRQASMDASPPPSPPEIPSGAQSAAPSAPHGPGHQARVRQVGGLAAELERRASHVYHFEGWENSCGVARGSQGPKGDRMRRDSWRTSVASIGNLAEKTLHAPRMLGHYSNRDCLPSLTLLPIEALKTFMCHAAGSTKSLSHAKLVESMLLHKMRRHSTVSRRDVLGFVDPTLSFDVAAGDDSVLDNFQEEGERHHVRNGNSPMKESCASSHAQSERAAGIPVVHCAGKVIRRLGHMTQHVRIPAPIERLPEVIQHKLHRNSCKDGHEGLLDKDMERSDLSGRKSMPKLQLTPPRIERRRVNSLSGSRSERLPAEHLPPFGIPRSCSCSGSPVRALIRSAHSSFHESSRKVRDSQMDIHKEALRAVQPTPVPSPPWVRGTQSSFVREQVKGISMASRFASHLLSSKTSKIEDYSRVSDCDALESPKQESERAEGIPIVASQDSAQDESPLLTELVLDLPLDWMHGADLPFPWDEVEYNRSSLQLSTYTGLDEVHSLFSFMSMAQVWITHGGQLQGVITDRALIEACLLLDDSNK